MPSPSNKPANHSPLLLVLMLLNVGGVFLLFAKSELDVQQIRAEVGIVRRAGEVANITEVECADGIRDESGSPEVSTTGTNRGVSRIVATGIGYVVRTNGACRGAYSLTNERRLPSEQDGEYVGLVSDLLIGGSPAGQILSQTSDQFNQAHPAHFTKVAFRDEKLAVSYAIKDLSLFDLPGCAVAITRAP